MGCPLGKSSRLGLSYGNKKTPENEAEALNTVLLIRRFLIFMKNQLTW